LLAPSSNSPEKFACTSSARLVLGPVSPGDLDDALGAGAELALWEKGAFARRLANAAGRRQSNASVHVKVDTGLNRLGFAPGELAEAVEKCLALPEIQISGVFSHFSSAEELDSPYTLHQLQRFERSLATVEPLFARSKLAPIRHIAASAAAILWPQTRLDMARIGIALYGLWPSKETREASNSDGITLEPALSYESELVVVRSVAAGASVGYGGTFHAPRAMRVGVVPVGYADGVPRALSNRGAFVVDGVRCPIAGRVAMNLTEIDLTHAPNARAGSTVTLIGRDGDAAVTADDWAEWAGTINYEIVTRLPSELPREYVD
jgi:alanine racemase